MNVGNPNAVSIREWVELCYETVGKRARFIRVAKDVPQRNYFCFSDYEYMLDVTGQSRWMPDTKPLREGLREAFLWYEGHADQVERRPYIEYVDEHLA